jgi:hypothetical protein
VSTCRTNLTHLTGVQNDWRTRFVSLVSMAAFQYPLWIKSRAWVVISAIAPRQTTEDMHYQLVRSLGNALAEAGKEDTPHIVSLVNCLSRMAHARPDKVNGALPEAILWFSIALLGSSTIPLFKEAAKLLPIALQLLLVRGQFGERTYNTFMGEANVHETILELEKKIGLSFRTDASFTTAALLFKGIKTERLSDVTKHTFETFIKTIVACQDRDPWVGEPGMQPIHPGVLPYFLALVPKYGTPQLYRELLKLCGAGDSWCPEVPTLIDLPGGLSMPMPVPLAPSIDPLVLGNMSENVVLMASTFICSMLKVAAPADPEVIVLYSLLAELSKTWPKVVSVW